MLYRFYSAKNMAADDDERRRNEHMDFLAYEGEGSNFFDYTNFKKL